MPPISRTRRTLARRTLARRTLTRRTLTGVELTGIVAAVIGLYVMALAGGGTGFWRSFLSGAPVGLEAVLSEEDLTSSSRLDDAFTRIGYRLETVALGAEVPALFLPRVPTDLAELQAIDTKKRVFLGVMLPLVLAVNDEIAADRARLEEIVQRLAAGRRTDGDDQAFVARLAERYGVEPKAPTLLRHVDAVPPSLALAQAAEESGWGTSRFVREGNNLYGQVTSAEEGLIPEGGQDGRRLAAFGTLYEAVRGYVHNLNTHRAYETLRGTRAQARARGAFPDGHSLAGSLVSYSERGTAYVDTVRTIIRKNGLGRFDRARLDRGLSGRWVSAGS